MRPATRIMVGGVMLAMAASAAAQGTQQSAPPAMFTELTACRDIADDAARLACFDAASAKLADAAQKREIVVLDQAEVRKTRRSLFGFNLPRLPFFGGGDDDEPDAPEFQEINTTVQSVRGLGYGKWRIGIDDGAVWQTTEAMRGTPKTGEAVKIRKGVMGAYWLSVDGGRAARAMRVN